MKESDITWSTIIPLIGGFPLGAEYKLNKAPKQIISYGFKNDDHYINWCNKKGYDSEVVLLNEDGSSNIPLKKVNIVVATPPLTDMRLL